MARHRGKLTVERVFAGGPLAPGAGVADRLRRRRRVLIRFASLLTVLFLLACIPGLSAAPWLLVVPIGTALLAIPGVVRLNRLIRAAEDSQ